MERAAVKARPFGWAAYALAWVAAAMLWSLAAASSLRQSPLSTFPFAALGMSVAAVMGAGVWHLSGRLAWDRRDVRFYAVHLACLAGYAVGYVGGFFIPDLARGRFGTAWSQAVQSRALGWNLLMGAWLYLVVAGLSYAVRAQQRVSHAAELEARAQATLREAQLTVLRARLNPHFFFNALHAISALLEDPVAADQALDQLGGLLRHALDERRSEVPLASEWAFTESYLAFEKLRFGDRLRSTLVSEPEAQAIEVPALLLQPLVENAVRHGIAPRPEGGTVEVRAGLDGGMLVLSVADDGPGASGAGNPQGIGLTSLRGRLQALYGGKAEVRIQTAPGAGYRVTLVLPTRIRS